MSGDEKTKVVIVGHVDHGKSTLIGRLLYDSGSLPPEKLAKIQAKARAQAKEVEFAYVLDALEEEQEQNVTIDITQVFFQTPKREYVIIDAPGHKEFIKNMVCGAAAADIAVLLVDAEEGVQEQTRRHSQLLQLLGIKNVLVVINKMDLVGYDQNRFAALSQDVRNLLERLDINIHDIIPASAKTGENVVQRSPHLSWHLTNTFIQSLDSFEKQHNTSNILRFPIQDVYRFDSRRILAGKVESGILRVGDRITFSPSNKSTTIKTIELWNDTNTEPFRHQSIGVTLEDPLFIERGEVASHQDSLPFISNKFGATVFWMSKNVLQKGQSLTLKLATQDVPCTVTEINNVIDSQTLEKYQGREIINQNDVAEITLRCDRPIAFDANVLATSRFVLEHDFAICGGGIIKENTYPDRRDFFQNRVKSTNIFWQHGEITKEHRETLNNHKGATIWLTGLSGAGKSTIAKELEKKLHGMQIRSYILDGDNIRHTLNADLGFSAQDRVENIRRVGHVARLLSDAGLIAISAFISPYEQDRAKIRHGSDQFIEVHVDCPLQVCQERDTKGLYKKAIAGEISNFTGISAPYEKPRNPDVYVNTSTMTVEECVNSVMNYLQLKGIFL